MGAGGLREQKLGVAGRSAGDPRGRLVTVARDGTETVLAEAAETYNNPRYSPDGDRLSIGEVVIEATAPRIPCGTLAAVIGDADFGLQFRDAERPGVYFRVISPGEISAGDRVRLIPVAKGIVTTQDLFRFVYERNPDPERLCSFLDAPVASRMRGKLASKLGSTA